MAKTKDLKEENIHRVRSCFYQGGSWTKTDLAAQTGISLAGMTNILQELEASGEIAFVGSASSTGGRKSKLYQLREDQAHIGTVLLSHPVDQYRIATHAFNLGGETVFEQELIRKTVTVAEILEIVKDLLAKDPLIQVLVISFPGIIGNQGQILSSDFKHLEKERLLQELTKLTDVPIFIENDVNCAVLAYQSQHPECQTLAVLYQPDQDLAGAGLIVNGQLHRGSQSFAGEVGYLDPTEALVDQEPVPRHVRDLLINQLTALTAILAPDAIAYYCPSLDQDITMTDTEIPPVFYPKLDRLMELDSLILMGVQELGKQEFLASKMQR